MASKRELKKYFQEQCNNVAGKAYPIFLTSKNDKRDKADDLLNDTVEVLEEFTSRVSSYPKNQKEAVQPYFANLKTDFDEAMDGLYAKLEKI